MDKVIKNRNEKKIKFKRKVLYTQALLGVARYFSGIIKFIFSMVFYLVFAVVIVTPLVFIVDDISIQLNESTWYLLLMVIAYGLILTPSFVYLKKEKLHALQKASYFLPR